MSSRNKLVGVGMIVLVILAIYFANTNVGKVLIERTFMTPSTLRHFDAPPKTNWKPIGERSTAKDTSVNARQVGYAIALHSDTHGSDEIGTAVAPMVELDWVAEPTMFVAEGPVFDSQNSIYFCPVFPKEKVSLISLDPHTGKRRWVLEDTRQSVSAGAGTPIILQDPESGKEMIYVGTYERLAALNLDGSIIYDVPTGLPAITPGTLTGDHHSFGMNYHVQLDAILGSMGDGSIYAFDRKTGRSILRENFVLPGDKTPLNNINIPKRISEKANVDFAPMYGKLENDAYNSYDPVVSVMHALSGEYQKVTNFFSIDKNSGRIWVCASLPDEEDGKKDGWSDFGALYGLDLVADGAFYKPEIKIIFKVNGGTSTTPTISADGSKIYIADAYDTVYAVDAISGKEIWSVNVGTKVTGSIVVSTDNGEIYVGTRNSIKRILEKDGQAKLDWTADLDMYNPGRFQSNMKVLGAEITANGLAFTGGVGIIKEKQRFPFKVGVGVLDRETGKVISFAEGGDGSVSSTVVGPDGSIYIGQSPLRRILARAVYGAKASPQTPIGGISRFKPARYDLLMRDALWAAANRLDNAKQLKNEAAIEQDIYQANMLINQSRQASDDALQEGNLTMEQWDKIDPLLSIIDFKLLSDISELENSIADLWLAVRLLED